MINTTLLVEVVAFLKRNQKHSINLGAASNAFKGYYDR